MKTLKPAPELCTGCRLCLLGCSFRHEEAFSEARARLKVHADEVRSRFEPVVCRQCADAPCIQACLTEAISRDAITGAVLLDANACIGCRACEEACNYGAIVFSDDTGRVQLCDLCGGAPECANSCPHGAIEYTP